MHAQQLPHAGHAPPIPMMPHPGLPGPPVTASASLLGLAGAAGSASHPLSMLGAKPTDMHRGADSDKPSSAIGKWLQYQHRIIYCYRYIYRLPLWTTRSLSLPQFILLYIASTSSYSWLCMRSLWNPVNTADYTYIILCIDTLYMQYQNSKMISFDGGAFFLNDRAAAWSVNMLMYT